MADTASDAFTLGDPLALLLDLVSVRPIPLRDAAGECTGYIGTVADINYFRPLFFDLFWSASRLDNPCCPSPAIWGGVSGVT